MTHRLLPGLCLFVMVAGCGESDEIKATKVPKNKADAKSEVAPSKGLPDAGKGPYAIFGAVFPADDPKWFFKITGSEEDVKAIEKDVDTFLATVKFPGGFDKPPVWDMPKEWKEGPPRQMRLATLMLGKDNKTELSISGAMGGLKANVERWAGQVGAEAGDTAKFMKEFTTAAGVKGMRVVVTGPKNPAGAMPPMMGR